MCHNFGVDASPAIPAHFFGPGSEPFSGSVCLVGLPIGPTDLGDLGEADTVIGRTEDPFDVCDLPAATEATVALEIVALSLADIEPIIVTVDGESEEWNVAVDLSEVAARLGNLTAIKSHCNGGIYTSVLNVQPRFTLAKVDDPSQVRVLDTGLLGIDPVALSQDVAAPWVGIIDPRLPVTDDPCSDMHPGIEEMQPEIDCDCNGNLVHDKCDPDCNGNGTPDDCDIADGASADCNGNGEPNECDIAAGTSQNNDGDVIPDTCDNCPFNPNPSQRDGDGDGIGDACEQPRQPYAVPASMMWHAKAPRCS